MRTSDFLKTYEGEKYLLCDGSEVPSSYPKLRILMTHTPDLRDRVPQGTGAYNVGTQIEAALPNIKGYIGNIHAYAQEFNNEGALYRYFSNGRAGSPESPAISLYDWVAIGIDASRCSTVYKNKCDTVQPPALAVAFYIKAK